MRDRSHHVVAVFGKVTEARHHRGADDVAATLFGGVGNALHRDAGEVTTQDEVDHTADGVGAIQRRRAVFQHFNAVHCRQRNRVEIDHTAVKTVRRHTATVKQHQCCVRALAAKVGGRDAVVAAVGSGGDVGVAGQIVHAIAIDRQRLHQLLDGRNAGAVKFGAGDHLHRQCAFGLHALDAATGDFNAFDLGRLRILRKRRTSNESQRHTLCDFLEFHDYPCSLFSTTGALLM